MKVLVYVVGTDPYDWEKSKVLSTRVNTSAGHLSSWKADLDENIRNSQWAWGAILEMEIDLETFEPSYKFLYVKGKKKEYLELNTSAKQESKKQTPKKPTVHWHYGNIVPAAMDDGLDVLPPL